MDIVKVKSLHEIDTMIAIKLGWVEFQFNEECSQFTPGREWNYGTDCYTVPVKTLLPLEAVNTGTMEEWADQHQYWYETNGGIPLFSSRWEDTEILIEACEESGLEIQWSRNKDSISCSIVNFFPITKTTGLSQGTPKSMSLATCLAILQWHHIKVELTFEELEDKDRLLPSF